MELLRAMGYGGADKRVARLGKSHDGGVDGVINQDRLGLDRVYVQVKRYATGNNIGREEIQKFVVLWILQGPTEACSSPPVPSHRDCARFGPSAP